MYAYLYFKVIFYDFLYSFHIKYTHAQKVLKYHKSLVKYPAWYTLTSLVKRYCQRACSTGCLNTSSSLSPIVSNRHKTKLNPT